MEFERIPKGQPRFESIPKGQPHFCLDRVSSIFHTLHIPMDPNLFKVRTPKGLLGGRKAPNMRFGVHATLSLAGLIGRECGNDRYKPSFAVSFKEIPRFIPSFPAEHQQDQFASRHARVTKANGSKKHLRRSFIWGKLPLSFQGSFFSGNRQKSKWNSWSLKRTMLEKNG